MRDLRRVLTWAWRAWAATPLVIASCSLLIGYLRALEHPPGILDLLEGLVGLGVAGLVCLPFVIAACYVHLNTSVPRWLVWGPLVLLMPLGFMTFLFYLFGDLGMAIRGFTRSIFEHG